MKRHLTPGKTDLGNRIVPVLVTIELDKKESGVTRLSIQAVEGPKANGDCWGGSGQARDLDLCTLSKGWTTEMVDRLRDVWNAWHLNDMRAGCEHQRAERWDERPIDPTKPIGAYGRHFDGQTLDTRNLLIWVRPEEHPEGLLAKACDECGYEYGTAWLTEEIPQDVIDFLLNLPNGGATR